MADGRAQGILRGMGIENFKFCWIAIVESAQTMQSPRVSLENWFPSFKFHDLRVMFRCAHHISEFVHRFVVTELAICDSPARVEGCFVSSQLEIAKESFAQLEQEQFRINTH